MNIVKKMVYLVLRGKISALSTETDYAIRFYDKFVYFKIFLRIFGVFWEKTLFLSKFVLKRLKIFKKILKNAEKFFFTNPYCQTSSNAIWKITWSNSGDPLTPCLGSLRMESPINSFHL